MLVDSHCHLASHNYSSEELDQVVANAMDQGVTRMVTIGTDLEDSAACITLAERFPGVYAAVGIHPCSVTEIDAEDWSGQIEQLANHPKVVAIGEIGLDYFHGAPEGWTDEDYRDRQMAFFNQQLELASRLGKNVIVHNRDRSEKDRPCWNDTLQAVLPFSEKLRAVLHCHTSDWESAKPLVDRGHLISFTGIVTYKSAAVVLEAAGAAVAGQFMVETDAPYLAPVPHRGSRCEPGYIRDTAECIAKARNVSIESLAAHTTETAEQFFGLS